MHSRCLLLLKPLVYQLNLYANNNDFTLPKALDSIISSILRYEAHGISLTRHLFNGYEEPATDDDIDNAICPPLSTDTS
jgi:hypothetical protein